MDTGIAELMQGMMGDVEMAPGSEMAEGVGSLDDGRSRRLLLHKILTKGAVRLLQEGGDVGILQALMAAAQPPKAETVKSYYESLLPVYQNIIGDPEEARRARQSDAYLRLAEMGFKPRLRH